MNLNLTVNFSIPNELYDLDKDGYITSKDQAILIEWITRNGYWRYLKNDLLSGMSLNDDPLPSPGTFPWNL